MPSKPFEAATKEYVDDKDAGIRGYVDSKPEYIAVNAVAEGLLRKGEYQFAFGHTPPFILGVFDITLWNDMKNRS